MDDLDLLDVVAGQGDEHDRLHLQARASRAAVFAAIEELATLRGIVVPPGTGLRQALVMVQSYAAVNTLD